MRPVAWFRQPRSNADTSGARLNVSSIWTIWRRLAGCTRDGYLSSGGSGPGRSRAFVRDRSMDS